MERDEEELQFLGFLGILGESAQMIIISQRKEHHNILFKITVTLILPLTFIFLSFSAITDLVSTLQYYWLIQATYFIFLLIFSILSTSTVVYTIASLYSDPNNTDLTFRKVIFVVPKVWKRLLVTFLCNFGKLVLYNFLAFFLFYIFVFSTDSPSTSLTLIQVIAIVFFGFYIVGFAYIGVVWHLASVLSVLEERCGVGAMRKSRELLRGKMIVAILVYLAVGFCFVGVMVLFENEVMKSTGGGIVLAGKVGYGVMCFLLLSVLFMFGMVVQTVVYLVCKSYHHENIGKSAHLDLILESPLPATDIQTDGT